VFSGFCHNVDEIYALLKYCAALSNSSVLTFWDNLFVPSSVVKKPRKKPSFVDFLTLEDRANSLSQNVSTELLLNAA
jgi:hypothetical protein